MENLQTETTAVNNTPPEIHYEPHPAANLFPPMTADEFAELVKDIRENGLINPVVIHDGLILDGRNRFRACKEAGVKTRFVFWENHADRLTPTQWVLAMNSRRRHLTPSQRAAIAVEALPMLEAEAKERMERGRPKEGVERIPQDTKGKARDKAAELTGANPRYVSDAKKIKEEAPELIEKVKAGGITIQQAKKAVKAKRKPIKRDPYAERWQQFSDDCHGILKAVKRIDGPLHVDYLEKANALLVEIRRALPRYSTMRGNPTADDAVYEHALQMMDELIVKVEAAKLTSTQLRDLSNRATELTGLFMATWTAPECFWKACDKMLGSASIAARHFHTVEDTIEARDALLQIRGRIDGVLNEISKVK